VLLVDNTDEKSLGSGFGNGNSTKTFHQFPHGVSQSLIAFGSAIRGTGYKTIFYAAPGFQFYAGNRGQTTFFIANQNPPPKMFTPVDHVVIAHQ
jgi:hypothetical protein